MKLKSFKQFRLEEMSVTVNDLEMDFSPHFFDRIRERGQFTTDEIEIFLRKISEKVKNYDGKHEFLFFSRKMKQGLVAAWDSLRKKLKIITFLPRGKDFAKTGTEKVFVESLQRQILYIEISD